MSAVLFAYLCTDHPLVRDRERIWGVALATPLHWRRDRLTVIALRRDNRVLHGKSTRSRKSCRDLPSLVGLDRWKGLGHSEDWTG